MATYTQILYQIVFSTKYRIPCLEKENRRLLYEYFYGALQKRNCHTYRINGIEGHTHIIFQLHPATSLSMMVKEIKHAGTYIIKKKNLFENFEGWQAGYGAFTYSQGSKRNLINYVINQEKHHKSESYIQEYKRLLKENGIKYDPKFLI